MPPSVSLFIYLNDCVSFYYLLCVCVEFIDFIFFLRCLNFLNLFLREENKTKKKHRWFSFVRLYLHGCCVCVFHDAFRSGYVILFCFFFFYISVWMFIVCLSLPARKNKQQRIISPFDLFIYLAKEKKNDRVLIFFAIVGIVVVRRIDSNFFVIFFQCC